jgi:Domain of unknown function (DUF397)
MTHDTGWFKSTYSGAANDACLEVRLTPTQAAVRDSKSPTPTELHLPLATWTTFLTYL